MRFILVFVLSVYSGITIADHGVESCGFSINNNTLLSESQKGILVLTQQSVFTNYNALSITKNIVSLNHSRLYSFGIQYGITQKFMLASYLGHISLNTSLNGSTSKGSALTDAVLLGGYQLVRTKNLKLQFISGFEIPTAFAFKSNENVRFNLISNSFDFIEGISLKHKFVGKSMLHQFNYLIVQNSSEGYNAGNSINYSVVYPLKLTERHCNENICCKKPLLFDLIPSLSLNFNEKHREQGIVLLNTGRTTLQAALNAMFLFKNTALSTSLSHPIYQTFKGTQNKQGLNFNLGLQIQLTTKKHNHEHE